MNNLSTIEKRGSFKNQIIAFVLLFMLPFCISAQEWDWYTCTHWQWKEYEKYRVFNNRWGTNDQVCMWANSPMSWGVTNTNLPNLSGNVKSFNSIYRGCHYSYCNPNETVLPVRLGDLTSFKGRWAHNKITTGRFLGLWDIYAWTNPQQHGNTIPGKGHWVFMVFQDVYDRTGWFQYPSVSDPLYQGRFYAGDYWWHVRHNPAGGWGSSGPVTIFYADPFSNDLTIDFKALIDLSIEKGWANANWYLGGIETGWEIIEGGNFETTAYWTAINDEPEGPGNCDPDAQITGMVITENEVFLPAGGTEYQLNVEFTPNEACHHLNEITWISDNPDVVSVSPGGVLLPKEKGEATIISYLVANPEIKDSVKITVDISYELKVVNGSGSGRYLEVIRCISLQPHQKSFTYLIDGVEI